MIFPLLMFWFVATAAEPAAGDDEPAVTAAALTSYFNLIHGGTGIAFPEKRRPVLLHRETIAPARTQLRVRVSSPANRAATLQYSAPHVQRLVARLQKLSAQSRKLRAAPRGYLLAEARRTRCGPHYDGAEFVDAVAVSRAAFQGPDTALIYVEYAGGARAYHAIRRGAVWEIDWHVELWACG